VWTRRMGCGASQPQTVAAPQEGKPQAAAAAATAAAAHAPGGPADTVSAEAGAGGAGYRDLTDDFGLGTSDSNARELLLGDAAPPNDTQDALLGASAIGGTLASPRPGSPAPAGAESPQALAAEIARVSSFDQKFAERTPSDWDEAFKAEMQDAMAAGAPPLAESPKGKAGFERISSFDQQHAQRTPSDWDAAFKAEMQAAMAPGSSDANPIEAPVDGPD
jgi:hypothetical protein